MGKRCIADFLCALCFVAAIAGCSKDDATTSQQNNQTLNASTNSVSVTTGLARNVFVSGGTPAYSISSGPNSSLATAALVNANSDTATIVITGVSTATGSTAVVVRDNSSTPKQVSISITKQ